MSEVIKDTTNKKKSLGRGIGSLIGGDHHGAILNSTTVPSSQIGAATAQAPARTATPAGPSAVVIPQAPEIPVGQRIWTVAVDKMKPSPYQPRTQFDRTKLEELATSIKGSGILQPIVVRKSKPEGSYEIVAGERRWRAAQIAGLHEVPVIVKDFDDKQTLELALIENVQREDLNPMEEAEAYQRLASEFSLTQQQVAEKVGRDRATVANALRLLALPTEVQDLVREQRISAGHAKVLLGIQDPSKIKSLARRVEGQGLSVRALERMLKEPTSTAPEAGPSLATRLAKDLEEKIQKSLGTRVNIEYNTGKGKLSVFFYSDEELNSLSEKLMGDAPRGGVGRNG